MRRPLCYMVLNQIQNSPEISPWDLQLQTKDPEWQVRTRWAVGELSKFGLLDETNRATPEGSDLMNTVTTRQFVGMLIANELLKMPEEPGSELSGD